MSCRKIKKRISSLLEGRIEGKERESIEAHINSCSACRREAEFIKQVHVLLNTLPSVEVSPFLADRILTKIKGRLEQGHIREAGISSVYSLMKWVTAVVAIIIGITMGTALGTRISTTMIWRQRESFELMAWEGDVDPVDPISRIIIETDEEKEI